MLRIALTGCVIIASFLTAATPSVAADNSPDVVYVPTPNDVVAKMLQMAKVKKTDLVYDLGCGDGRIVVTAARKFGAKGVGFDINPQRLKESNENIKKYNVGKLVKVENKNIFDLDLSKASVITLYLLPKLNVRLIPQIEKMKPGSRIVSHNYDMEGIKPTETVQFKSREDNITHTIYLWTVPLERETSE
ncbi:MAG: methyltransferase domain-containing protein [Planctomycetota bacterium]|nr:methyltransferase domain-containing protein [Planctomycetota bacterium]